MENYPFHPYHSKEAQGILSDILDEYFPYELKEKYKDGIPLKVIDHTAEKYEEKLPNANVLPKEIPGIIPKPIISKPYLWIKIIRENLAPQAAIQTIEVETQVAKAEKEGKVFDKSETATLRIRTENGKQYLIIKLLVTDIMKSVYEYSMPYRYTNTLNKNCSEKQGQFIIRSTFPKKEFTQNEPKSLQELGLIPTAALVMQ